jgi:hypothetical protein
MKRFMSKKVAAIGLAAGIALGAGGAAFAYFTTNGSGTGSASVGSTPTGVNNLAVTVAAPTGAAKLFPTVLGDSNATVQTFAYAVKNTTEADINLSTEKITVSDTGGCLGSWFSVDGTSPTGANTQTNVKLLKPSSDAPLNEYDGSFTLQLVENSGPQDACQGVTPTVTVAAS